MQHSGLIALLIIVATIVVTLALRPITPRHNFGERMLGTGTWGLDLVEDRPTGKFSVSFRRTGVQPTAGGCGCLIPFWLLSRLRWQFGPRTWTVQVRTGKPLPLGMAVFRQVVFEQTVTSKEEGQRAANVILQRLRAGELDYLALESSIGTPPEQPDDSI